MQYVISHNNAGNCSGTRGYGCCVWYNAGPRIPWSVFMAPDDRVITALQCILSTLLSSEHSLRRSKRVAIEVSSMVENMIKEK